MVSNCSFSNVFVLMTFLEA